MKSIAIKTPKTENAVHPLLLKRWSARSFSSKPLSKKDLNTLFEAASWAPSSMNEQPWEFWYVTRSESEKFDLFLNCLMEGNKSWAKNAHTLILNLAHKNFKKTGQYNRHYLYDCGAANTNLLLQAAELDIYGHLMGGFHMEKTIQDLSIPEGLEPVCFIALGYLDAPEKLEEPFLTRELTARTRKGLGEFVKGG